MSANHYGVTLNQLVSTIPVRRKLIDQSEREKFEWNQVCTKQSFMRNHISNLFP